MNVIMIIMLLCPGVISMRILWHNKNIQKNDYFMIFLDYAVYTFLIQTATYGVLFFSYPYRTVSFFVLFGATSNIISAGFVFKYSFVSLVFAVLLPVLISLAMRIWHSLEDKRKRG